MKESTGVYMFTFDEANTLSKTFTKKLKVYFTSIKGTSVLPYAPEKCWAVTNKFDPRVGVKN